MVDSRNGSNLLYLPLDRLLQQGAQPAATPPPPTSTATPANDPNAALDARSREGVRSRDRETRAP
jgi:modulator of FtsH protease HflK